MSWVILRLRRYLVGFLTVIAFGGFLQAATVYFKDGSQMTGTVVYSTVREVQLQTPDGLLKINTDRIARIDYAETVPPPAPAVDNRRDSAPQVVHVFHEEDLGRQDFSISFGLASPMSRVSFGGAGGGRTDNGDAGILLGAQYMYGLSPRWSAGFNVEYFNRTPSDSLGALPFSDTSVEGNTLNLLGMVKFAFLKQGTARPYISAGLGTNRTSTVIDAKPVSGFAWSDTNSDETRRLVDDSNWGLASTVRLGIDFRAMDPSFFSFELGWIDIANNSYSATSAGRDLGLNEVTGHINAFSVAGRWGWRF